MAAAFVAERAKGAGTPNPSLAIPVSGVTVGNHLIILLCPNTSSGGTSVSSVTDNGSNSYQADQAIAATAAVLGFYVYSVRITGSAPTSITVTLNKSGITMAYKILEFSGLHPTAWFD